MKKYLMPVLSCIIIMAMMSGAFASDVTDESRAKSEEKLILESVGNQTVKSDLPVKVPTKASEVNASDYGYITVTVPSGWSSYEEEEGYVLYVRDQNDSTQFIRIEIGRMNNQTLYNIARDVFGEFNGTNFSTSGTGYYYFGATVSGQRGTMWVYNSSASLSVLHIPDGWYCVVFKASATVWDTYWSTFTSINISVPSSSTPSGGGDEDYYAIHADSDGLHTGTTGTYYSETLTCDFSGATWAVEDGSSLPPGLDINSSTGVIYGTPTTAGTYSFYITAKWPESGNVYRTDMRDFTITITQGSSNQGSGTRGTYANMTITVPSGWNVAATYTNEVDLTDSSGNVIMLITAQIENSLYDEALGLYRDFGNMDGITTLTSPTQNSNGYYSFTIQNSYGTEFIVYLDDHNSKSSIVNGDCCAQIVTKTTEAREALADIWSTITFTKAPSSSNGGGNNAIDNGEEEENVINLIAPSKVYTIGNDVDQGDDKVNVNYDNRKTTNISGGGCNAGIGFVGLVVLGLAVIRRKS